MSSLTPKQEGFCQDYVLTSNATEAYRRNYSTAKQKPASINRNAKAMMDNIKISSRIAELRKEVRNRHDFTVDGMTKRFEKLVTAAETEGKYGPAVSALKEISKLHGLYIKKVEVRDVTVEDMLRDIRDDEPLYPNQDKETHH